MLGKKLRLLRSRAFWVGAVATWLSTCAIPAMPFFKGSGPPSYPADYLPLFSAYLLLVDAYAMRLVQAHLAISALVGAGIAYLVRSPSVEGNQ